MSCKTNSSLLAVASLVGQLGMPLLDVQPAAAISLTWTLSNATFSDGVLLSGVTYADGGTASGSFDYDAATNQYSNINVVTGEGYTYRQLGWLSEPQPLSNHQNLYLFREKTSLNEPFSSAVKFQFAHPLTNAMNPGLIAIAAASEERITRGPQGLDIETRTLVPGTNAFISASTQAVPEPISAIGLGVAGVCFWWMKKQKSSQNK
ncbi:PEP-CTERM sorting domain-containing protein [Kovacikia minuta CCNUW1]|uniref:PEP-CTERM sorting domain-containing protein n=1 Tax=Kovacikia minuta TaxID=2931930 RepID=UPI001CCC59E1|nr:PEP-CTERM sorting domain-containing protein [Kovacikia minuta]UBF29206.1 PEP-CTERM sorting domain-containing protein [Kovacikia minuta CCNUW1]